MAPQIVGALFLITLFHSTCGARPERFLPTRWTEDNVGSFPFVLVNESVLLWGIPPDQLIAQGWGSRVLYMAAMHDEFKDGNKDGVWAMPPQTLKEYNAFDLYPPITTSPSPQLASANGTGDKLRGIVADMHLLDEELPPEGISVVNRWSHSTWSRTLFHQDLAGCREHFDAFIWQMFERVIAKGQKPFADYIGLHVRRGDKVKEGDIADLHALISIVQKTPRWRDLRNFFVATDDLDVLEQEVRRFHPPEDAPGCLPHPRADGLVDLSQGQVKHCIDEYAWNWTKSNYRHRGGEPDSCGGDGCHHEHSAGSTRAVLSDTISLALAPVLVGSFNSNFFKLPWLLNYMRRTPEQRQEHWCWDVYTSQPCHNRFDFSTSFTRKVNGAVGILPDGTDLLRECLDPTLLLNRNDN